MKWHKFDLIPGFYYAYVPNEKEWKRELKRLGCAGTPYPKSDATCTHLSKPNKRSHRARHILLITLNDRKRPALASVVLIVHECMHIWRRAREHIGERKPSAEFEAYMMQKLVEDILFDYNAKHRVLRGK